jgi:hypothetical protein
MKKSIIISLVAVFLTLAGNSVFAQESTIRLEARGGFGLPTFDIADAAEIGPGGGVGIWYSPVNAGWTLGAEGDFGIHGGADNGPDINVYHLMGKAGYIVYASSDNKMQLVLNGGAGMVMFDVDAPGADMKSYPAINAGGKIYYALSPSFDFVVSLQGDIAFTNKDVLGTDNAWVWPIGVGFAIKF